MRKQLNIRLTEQMARDIATIRHGSSATITQAVGYALEQAASAIRIWSPMPIDDSGHETDNHKPNTLETVDELGLV